MKPIGERCELPDLRVYAPEARAAIYALALDLRAVCEGFNGMGFASPADNLG